MLLGQVPFRAETPSATLMAHIHQPVPLPTSIDPTLERRVEAVLLKALAKAPEDRYESATVFTQAMTPAALGEKVELDSEATVEASVPGVSLGHADKLVIAHEAPIKEPLAASGRRTWAYWLIAAVLLVGVGLAGAIFVFSDGAGDGDAASPAASAPDSVGHITYSLPDNCVYRVEAPEGAVPHYIGASLGRLSEGNADVTLNLSPDGLWLALATDRFDSECAKWTCVAVLPWDLSSGDAVRSNPGIWDVVHPDEGISAVPSGGQLIVVSVEQMVAPHVSDLVALKQIDGGWTGPTVLTAEFPYLHHLNPAISSDGSRVAFQCAQSIGGRACYRTAALPR